MTESTKAPESTLLRLSRYHCFLGELQHGSGEHRITSHELAEELGLSEETVRRDLSYIDIHGRPGAGYATGELYRALRDFLDLTVSHPFVVVGNKDVLRGLEITFPAEEFGLSVAAYFSECADDVDAVVYGEPIRALADIPRVARGLGVSIALVACAPEAVAETLELLGQGGVHGVLMLTPVLRPQHPEGMSITFFRMPCALKSLVST